MPDTADYLVAATGSVLSLDLEGQGVGGYIWTIADLPPGIELAAEPHQEVEDPSVGGAAVLRLQLRVGLPGRYLIVLERRRPWGGEPAERRTITLDVE